MRWAEEYAEDLRRTECLQTVPVYDRIRLEDVALGWDPRGPADRTIAALARLRNLQIVTSDKAIRAFYPSRVW